MKSVGVSRCPSVSYSGVGIGFESKQRKRVLTMLKTKAGYTRLKRCCGPVPPRWNDVGEGASSPRIRSMKLNFDFNFRKPADPNNARLNLNSTVRESARTKQKESDLVATLPEHPNTILRTEATAQFMNFSN